MAAPASATSLSSVPNATYLRQKRARSQLSCVPCRAGKLKCSRTRDPACDQCIKRNREGQCIYVPPPAKQKPAQNVKGRIRQLETLVVELMNSQAQIAKRTPESREAQETGESGEGQDREQDHRTFAEPTPPSDTESYPRHAAEDMSVTETRNDVDCALKPFGQLRISKNGMSYVGDSHWQTILNSISDLKRDVADDDDSADENGSEDDTEISAMATPWGYAPPGGHVPATTSEIPPHEHDSNGFLLGHARPMTKDEIIASVPDKKITDRLLSLWFNSPDPFRAIIHGPTFQLEYKSFLREPKSTPVMWIGLLFAILSLASSFGLRDLDPDAPAAAKIQAEVHKYHSLAASAALGYTRTKQYTIECIILYAAGLRSDDAFVNVWLTIGVVIRLALRMGYHRDPANYPAISPFDGEMRRRTWAIISMIDVLISFQLGLPSMVKTIQSDTAPPRNILDRDFSRSSTELPPNRGIDELTPCSYVRAKLQIVRIFADATELSHSTFDGVDDQMLALDKRLEDGKAQIPPLLQMPDFSELVTDPAEQLMCRFNLDLLYLKTKIIIHRRSMQKTWDQLTHHEQAQGIGESRKACVDSALRVLHHHHTIYNASQTGGQLESVKWYMGSISTHDFLLAAMIICLELSQQISNDPAVNPGGRTCPFRETFMDALEKSQKIWSDASRRKGTAQFVGLGDKSKGEHMFSETEKASQALAMMLKKVRATFPEQDRALAAIAGSSPPALSCGAQHPKPTSRPRAKFAPYAHLVQTDVSFSGIISQHDWADATGLPHMPGYNMAQPYNAFAEPSLTPGLTREDQSYANTTNNPTPESMFVQSDYAMLGDLLDAQGTLDFDWDMLDDALQVGKVSRQNPFLAGSAPMNPALYVNSGPGDQTTLPNPGFPDHNTTSSSANDPGSGDNVYPGSWMAFPNMRDVDFDLSIPAIDAQSGMPYASDVPETWE